jgi:hypothetical protein
VAFTNDGNTLLPIEIRGTKYIFSPGDIEHYGTTGIIHKMKGVQAGEVGNQIENSNGYWTRCGVSADSSYAFFNTTNLRYGFYFEGIGETVSFLKNGKVGIGTTSPGYDFESALSTASLGNKAVIIGYDNEIWSQPQTNSTASLYINYRGYAGGLSQFRDLYIANGKGTTIASFVGASGNVGIGRTPTTHKLEVEGSSLITTKLYLGTTTAPATDTGTLNSLVWNNTTGEVKQRTITSFDYYQSSVTSSSTPTPVGSHKENEYYLTTLAVSATFAAPSGTPANGNTLLIRIKDNGTARTLSWNSIYRIVGTTLPTTTTVSKTLYVGCIYNSTDSKWDVVSVVEQT